MQSRQRIVRLAPLHEIEAAIASFEPAAAVTVPILDAIGAVLAAPVTVTGPVPAQAIAARDGWAVASADTVDASSYAPMPLAVKPMWVEAGQPLPGGADAVLPPDGVEITSGIAHAVVAAAPSENVLPRGFHVERTLLEPGRRLRPSDAMALAHCAVDTISVRRPCVRVIAIKSHAAGTAAALAKLIELGGGTASTAELSDRPLKTLLDSPDDALVLIGGTGEGQNDRTISALRESGDVILHGFGIRPGETAALARVNEKPVLALPGRFDAALSAWLVAGKNLLSRLGDEAIANAYERRSLTRKITSTVGLAEAILVKHVGDGVEPIAAGVFPASALTSATGWVLVPPDLEGYASGMIVDVRPLA
ncbi:molybdopterin molybdenumtransferase [Variibacter gotjawalensis]|uniref:Molybdopterin molybdenumtransferase n=1 Tax=Variibacter gotjawalensis TaxID=1333996 RepID=A0A0S3PWU6_9BRAD|nr:molybdopterin-binding protein [Variibacter gotjawalensis]NIK46218.1 molybdopterin biosynthesis enzyme [Variibacter gotjawalensis]RZS48134.1 molybdopterin biosynthesis enzyme [Variibacter gotjawalensis]BAT60391.1 molybdopterin molybdenumtransferase [Variibacter gotjawalensis]